MIEVDAKLVEKNRLAKGVYLIELLAPEIASKARSGQFVQILCGKGRSHILRRPFSIAGYGDGKVSILFEVVGAGTAFLANETVLADELFVIGPLGTGFNFSNLSSVDIIAGGGLPQC